MTGDEATRRIYQALLKLAVAKRQKHGKAGAAIRERIYRMIDGIPEDVDSQKVLIANLLNAVQGLGERLSYEDRVTLANECYAVADCLAAPEPARNDA